MVFLDLYPHHGLIIDVDLRNGCMLSMGLDLRVYRLTTAIQRRKQPPYRLSRVRKGVA
ncbi:hypothetical protein EDD99_5198 [Streptomyces sp. 846.5]|nr:hypothetical protein EDD99_5198 [Streptomyces sp. 846.5]